MSVGRIAKGAASPLVFGNQPGDPRGRVWAGSRPALRGARRRRPDGGDQHVEILFARAVIDDADAQRESFVDPRRADHRIPALLDVYGNIVVSRGVQRLAD